jgi:hypothetical protein
MLCIPRLVLIHRNKRIDPHRESVLLLRRGPRNRRDPLAPRGVRGRPMIPTRVPGPAPFFFSGAYTVMPLHSIGAAAALLSASGILTTKCTGTRTRSLYPP